MFKSISIGIIAALAFTSVLVIAGSVNDNYNVGDTLTTTILDNIKAAINDNNNASRFYGDGSAGDFTVNGMVSFISPAPAGKNLNFADFTINTGSTLEVAAGTTIRCSGSFTNNGTINVNTVNSSGQLVVNSAKAVSHNDRPGSGDAPRAAGNPEADTVLGVFLRGGSASDGILETVAASSFNSFRFGGGGGGAIEGAAGAGGGGLVKIYCKDAIVNAGAINADGGSGVASGGGGGGGIVILASSTSINNSGSISANGGAGGNSNAFHGASASGGGGIIILAAPTTIIGSTSVANGAIGIGSGAITAAIHSAGAGGGASGGKGGNGSSVSSINEGASPGTSNPGYALEINANPAHMM